MAAEALSVLPELAIASPLQRQSATIDCPRSMVGRVIGKGGDTIKALQKYTGALIQIDQSVEPTKVTISGTSESLMLAMSMVIDIVKGTFKGFALLRQLINPVVQPGGAAPLSGRPVYAPGYGLVPPVQVVNGSVSTPVTSTLLSSPSSSLDDQLYSTLSSPTKSLGLQQVGLPQVTMPQVSLPHAMKPGYASASQFTALDSPSTSLGLLRPAPTSSYAMPATMPTGLPATRFVPPSSSIFGQYPTGGVYDNTAASLFQGKLSSAAYHSIWPDTQHLGLTSGSAALSNLMAPTSPTIGVSWDALTPESAYYATQVTN